MQSVLRKVELDAPDYSRTLELRERVLLAPFGIPLELARADDTRAVHFGLFDGTGGCEACLLLVPREPGTLQMRQVAVAPEWQRTGLGRALVSGAEAWAKEAGHTLIFAHARDTALPFYRALGYAEVGEPFVQVGLPHRRVDKALSGAF